MHTQLATLNHLTVQDIWTDEKIFESGGSVLKFFKNNIHTLLLLAGFGLIDYSFFRLDLTDWL